MVILSASSAIVAPVLLGPRLPLAVGNTVVKISALTMVGTLLGLQLLLLRVGVWICHSRSTLADNLTTPVHVFSFCLNVLLLVVIISAQLKPLAEIYIRSYIGMACLVLVTLVAGGRMINRLNNETGRSMILTTSVRNVGVTLVTATASFPDTAAITGVTAYGMFKTISVAVVAIAWGCLARDATSLAQRTA